MGWRNMPSDTVTESLERYVIEGKAFEVTPEFDVQDGTSSWLYIETPPTKDMVVYSITITATNGPVRIGFYPEPVIVGDMNGQVFPEPINKKNISASDVVIHQLPDTSIDVSESTRESQRLVAATQAGGLRGRSATAGSTVGRIVPAGTSTALRLDIEQGVNQGYVEVHIIWVEDEENK